MAFVSAAVALGAGLIAAAPARAAAQWQLEQPPPPAGARFKVPLGRVGDLEFYAPNAGLMSVEGNATEPRGLYFYDGRSWRLLSSVCTDTADTSRIAWAGPNEFWVVTQPSFPRSGSGLGLCHFKNGAVVAGGSYSTPIGSSDPFFAMDAAACNGPNDCWFGGTAATDPLGQREGSFQIHWDGANLTTSYSPQGRGISDIQFFQGKWYETAFAGAQRENRTDPTFVTASEPFGPELLRGLGPDGVWRGLNWLPDARDGVPGDGSEVLAINASATDLWFAGGGAASGPDAPSDGSFPRPPFAVHQARELLPGGPARHVPVSGTPNGSSTSPPSPEARTLGPPTSRSPTARRRTRRQRWRCCTPTAPRNSSPCRAPAPVEAPRLGSHVRRRTTAGW